jgi:predicted N-acetyltransferase YhbS
MTSSDPAATIIRPLRDDDVAAADDVAWHALHEVGQEFGFSMGVRDDARIAWAQARIRHIAAHDPEGSVVAERDGQVIGIGLAVRRGSLWFLSLLAVRSGQQGGGVGRRLLDATLEHGRDCPRAMICASPDPKALRRYGRAGFGLHAGYEASGVADRSELPADLGVREGDWDRDAELFEELVTDRRGEPLGPDLDFYREQGMRLLVRDGGTPADRAAVVMRPGKLGTLAAASDNAAVRVLWAALAESPGEVTVGYLLGNQQWAIDVALAAKLPLKLTDTLCTRGFSPPASYLPSGIFG